MKTRICPLIRSVALALVLGWSASLPAPVHAAEYLSVAGEGVTLRSGPGLNFDALFRLPSGYPLRVLDRKEEWILVQDYEGDRGWILNSFVGDRSTVIVRVREAKIREAPGRSAAELGTAGREVIFRKTGTQGDWVRVSHSKVDGWVHKSLVWP